MANFNFNKVIIGGRLTADPELKTTPSGISVTTFTVAVNRRYKQGEEQKADFFNVTAWRETAEIVVKFFKKASTICFVGRIQNRNWTDDSGQKHYATDIVADEVYFVDSKAESNSESPKEYIPNAYTAPAAKAPQIEEIDTDEDLPF